MNAAGPSPRGASGQDEGFQYLSFVLGDEEYGLDILCVQEIRGWTGATPLPNAPPYVRGVMNLRGAIVPVIDLRERFGQEALDYDRTTVVIVVRSGGTGRERTMGLVVDGVVDVYSVSSQELSPAPGFGAAAEAGFARELARVGERLVIVLDVEQVLGDEIEFGERGPSADRPAVEGE